MIIMLQIRILKYLYISLVITLVSPSNWQVTTEGASAITNYNNQYFPIFENRVVFVFTDDNYYSYKNAQNNVFIIKTSIGVIVEVTGPVIVFINDKLSINQDAKNRM